MDTVNITALNEAVEQLKRRGAQARPYASRIESACNIEMTDVITIWADEAHQGSRSDAIRDLIARGAATLA